MRKLAQSDVAASLHRGDGRARTPSSSRSDADLERAALGIVRSAYGMGGQKCSALSRIYVDEAVADALRREARGRDRARSASAIRRRRETGSGRSSTRRAARATSATARPLARDGARIFAGGRRLTRRRAARTAITARRRSPRRRSRIRCGARRCSCRSLMLARVRESRRGDALANDSSLGLTAGFYGGADEVPWFFDHIEAGVTYANRPQGATTGAWPGYQPFGGWKGSGSDGQGHRLVLLPARSTCASSRRPSSSECGRPRPKHRSKHMKNPHIRRSFRDRRRARSSSATARSLPPVHMRDYAS